MNTPLIDIESDTIRKSVRERYGKIAESEGGCGCAPTCCALKSDALPPARNAAEVSQNLGYSTEQTGAVPEGAAQRKLDAGRTP